MQLVQTQTPMQIQVVQMPVQMPAPAPMPTQRTPSQPVAAATDCCLKSACGLTNCLVTFFLCYINIGFCASVSTAVMREEQAIGIIFLIVTVLWNLGCTIRVCKRCRNEEDLKKTCWASCLSVVALSAASFTLITRYHYYELHPKKPNQQDTSLLAHKMGLISLVAGIPVMYGCKFKYLMHDKKMIYRVIVDFIDIYEMAEILALGAPTCTSQLDCIESKNSAVKKGGWIEVTVQILCSVSFLTFFVLYGEAMKEGDRNSEFLQKFTRITRLVQDIPFFAIRLLVWMLYGFDTDQFIFLVKNTVTMGLIALEFSCATCGGLSVFKSDEENQTSDAAGEHVNEGLEMEGAGQENDAGETMNVGDQMDAAEPRDDKQQEKKNKKEKRPTKQPVSTLPPQQTFVIQQDPGMPPLSAEQQQRLVMQALSALPQGYTGQPIIIRQTNQGVRGVPTQQMVRK